MPKIEVVCLNDDGGSRVVASATLDGARFVTNGLRPQVFASLGIPDNPVPDFDHPGADDIEFAKDPERYFAMLPRAFAGSRLWIKAVPG